MKRFGENWPRQSQSGRSEERENIHSPVAEVVILLEVPEAGPEDVVWAPETAPVVAADALEAAPVPPALAAELTGAVAPAEAGHEAAEGNTTLTLCQVAVSEPRVL